MKNVLKSASKIEYYPEKNIIMHATEPYTFIFKIFDVNLQVIFIYFETNKIYKINL